MSIHATSTEEEDRLAEEWLAEHTLSDEEARQIVDTQARELLGLSLEELVHKVDTGEIVDDDTDWRITYLVNLLPIVGKIDR